jgi:hypothetical protein
MESEISGSPKWDFPSESVKRISLAQAIAKKSSRKDVGMVWMIT